MYLDAPVTVIFPERRAPLSVRSFGLTDAGNVRTTNQDQFLVAVLLKALQVEHSSLSHGKLQQSPDRSHLFVVVVGNDDHHRKW